MRWNRNPRIGMSTSQITYYPRRGFTLPLQGLFTYRIPQELNDCVGFGMRVVVPFGKSKLYSGLVMKVHENAPRQVNTKYVLDVIDKHSVVSERQIQLWQWIANYYMCSWRCERNRLCRST